MTAKRLTLKRVPLSTDPDAKKGEQTRKLVVADLPASLRLCDTVNLDGFRWVVAKIENTEIIATLKIHRAKPVTSPSSALNPTTKKLKSGYYEGGERLRG